MRAERLAGALGLGELWIKNDTLNPTNSFKDRVVAVGLSKALEFGFKTAACASTGNLANSVAAHATRAGMKSYVFIPSNLESGKVIATAIYGGNVVAVDGNYDDVNRLCAELAGTYPWAFVNVNFRPYYAEGSKTLAFETAEQLGWRFPDHVVVPDGQRVAADQDQQGLRGAGQGRAHRRGAADVRVSGAQAARVLADRRRVPVGLRHHQAGEAGHDRQVAGHRQPGRRLLRPRRRPASGGGMAAVTDDEIIDGMKLLARTEGIFTETAGGVTIATLKRLTEEGVIRPDECVVAYITGHGLKTLEALTGTVGPTATIAPTIDAFTSAFDIDEES